MNGVHDMGGMDGLGPIECERDEPVFHEAWEGRVYALSRAARAFGKWSLDADRHAVELLSPLDYFGMSYYERWFARLIKDVLKYGLVTKEEIETGRPAPGAQKSSPALTTAMSSKFLSRGLPSSHDPAIQPRFAVGDRVRARNIQPAGHTRLPRYARGKTGTISRDHGVYHFPDTVAHGLGEKRQHVYSVLFGARELWGDTASARDHIHIDMWDDYLEPV
jgi:nitrile hydratase subunit beta